MLFTRVAQVNEQRAFLTGVRAQHAANALKEISLMIA
jgi:hypothetical protein